ncbi:MAG: hypothetical protein DCC75_09965 [Proteobacteria bacterium]|nr:MAG: hypothetical protein DCC75_09965 [Pseudomonadota bacterium]
MINPVIDFEAYNLFDLPKTTGTPERRLLLAVLERAILDYVGNDAVECKAAEEWLFSESDEEEMDEFTFLWVCQQLDLNAKQIAATIKRMPRRGKHKVAPWYFAKGHFAKEEEGNSKSQVVTRKVVGTLSA